MNTRLPMTANDAVDSTFASHPDPDTAPAAGGISAEALTQNQGLQPATVLPQPDLPSDALMQMVAEVLPLAARVPFRPEFPFPGPVDSYNHWGLND